MAYSAANDRSKAIKTIFLRPGDNLIADEMAYGSSDINIYPGMCLDLVNSAKYSSGDAANKGGYYAPQVANFDYYAGKTVLDEWTVSSKIPVRTVTPGSLVALRVGAGTTSNYAKGTYLVNQLGVASTAVTGLTFNSGTLELGTVSHFIVEEAPAEDIASVGLIVARCIPVKVLEDINLEA